MKLSKIKERNEDLQIRNLPIRKFKEIKKKKKRKRYQLGGVSAAGGSAAASFEVFAKTVCLAQTVLPLDGVWGHA
jgi:hypothetical protein